MNKDEKTYISFDGTWLGDVIFTPKLFKKDLYNQLNNKSLKTMSSFEKHKFVSSTLLEEIKVSQEGEFILPAIIDFIEIVRASVLPSYKFNSFEMFLDNYSNLSEKEALYIRGKIIGRYIPRSEYQAFFPIGLGGTFKGSHFSVAHFSPDVDSVIASFHGFLDAFAAKVGTGMHYWNVPSGPPSGSIEIENLFGKALGKGVFNALVNTSRALSLTSMDLVSQKNIIVKKQSDKSIGINHRRSQNSVIVTDEKGRYLADWRDVDYDEVRMVINNFTLILRNIEQALYMAAIDFLTNKTKISSLIDAILNKKISDFIIEDTHDKLALDRLDLFSEKVLEVMEGLNTRVKDFFAFVDQLKPVSNLLSGLNEKSNIENILKTIHETLKGYISYLDSLEVAIAVKRKVLGICAVTLSHTDHYETIAQKMDGFSHLTVLHDEDELEIPMGVIHAKDIKGTSLGTVSIRDFSNNEEMDKASYMDIISCIDHHKSELKTSAPARMIVSDAQSSNSMIARMNMEINKRYSTGGYSVTSVNGQISALGSADSKDKMRLMKRLMSKKSALSGNNIYFISKDKEFLDYYHFLFAILDDTDLLTKVTAYDVYVVLDLLNNMKSLMVGKEVEIVNFDDLDEDSIDFAKEAAKKLMATHDLYSLYNDNYVQKEKRIEEVIKKATQELEKTFFQDTKVTGKYAQVGQFKLFSSNHGSFQKRRSEIQKHWLFRCEEAAKENADLSLFVMMISTIDSADDLFSGSVEKKSDAKDEIWISLTENDKEAFEKTKRFLLNLLKSSKIFPQTIVLNLHGTLIELKDAVAKVSGRVEVKAIKGKASIAELYVDLKSIKSRKADIAPYI